MSHRLTPERVAKLAELRDRLIDDLCRDDGEDVDLPFSMVDLASSLASLDEVIRANDREAEALPCDEDDDGPWMKEGIRRELHRALDQYQAELLDQERRLSEEPDSEERRRRAAIIAGELEWIRRTKDQSPLASPCQPGPDSAPEGE